MIRTLMMTTACMMASTAAFAADQFEWEVAKEYTFIVPNGFDDNDEVTIAIDGYLPSTCHKLGDATWKLNESNRTIYIEQKVKKFSGACAEVLVPFTNYVSIPHLPQGEFTLTGPDAVASKMFMVAEAQNAGPDDHLYAPVESISMMNDTNGTYFAVIEGRLTNSCMKWDEIKVLDSGESIVVLPILKMEEGSNCVDIEKWFKTTVNLPQKDPMTRFMLHVRSLNGHALNAMYTVKVPVVR